MPFEPQAVPPIPPVTLEKGIAAAKPRHGRKEAAPVVGRRLPCDDGPPGRGGRPALPNPVPASGQTANDTAPVPQSGSGAARPERRRRADRGLQGAARRAVGPRACHRSQNGVSSKRGGQGGGVPLRPVARMRTVPRACRRARRVLPRDVPGDPLPSGGNATMPRSTADVRVDASFAVQRRPHHDVERAVVAGPGCGFPTPSPARRPAHNACSPPRSRPIV